MIPRFRGLAFACGLVATMAACGGGDKSPVAPTAPGGPALDPACPPSASPLNCAPAKTLTIAVSVNAFTFAGGAPAPFTYAVGGFTVSGSGPQYARIVGLSPGTIELSGQTQGENVSVRVGIPPTDTGGSIPPASVESVEGPQKPSTSPVTPCQFEYFRNPGPVTFKLRFTLNAAGAAQNDSCHS